MSEPSSRAVISRKSFLKGLAGGMAGLSGGMLLASHAHRENQATSPRLPSVRPAQGTIRRIGTELH